MKKHGYTLAELLISITIIGILAAITLPLVNKYKPDGDKALYLTSYDSIVNAVLGMANNTIAYPPTSTVFAECPLFNTSEVTIDGNTISGNSAKFCNLLALSLNTTGTISCSENYSANPVFTKSFATTNGVVFQVLTRKTNAIYQSDVYIDINGENKGNNCFYSNNCKNPDRFKFLVAATGKVHAADQKGQLYLDTRTNMRKGSDKENDASKYTAISILPNSELYPILMSSPIGIPTTVDKSEFLLDGGNSNEKIDTSSSSGLTLKNNNKTPIN